MRSKRQAAADLRSRKEFTYDGKPFGGFLNTAVTLLLPFYLLDVSLGRKGEETKEKHKFLS